MQRKVCLLIPLVAFLFLPSASQAQTSKGTVLLGGSLSYYQHSQKTRHSGTTPTAYSSRSIGISPNAGYFLADNLAVGTGAAFNFSRNRYNEELQSKFRGWGLSPFVRYYKFIGEKVAFFGQANLSFNKGTQKNNPIEDSDSFQYTSTQEDFYTALMPGLSYFPTPRLGFQFTIGQLQFYKSDTEVQNTYTTPETRGNSSSKAFSANFGISQANIGLNYFFFK
jgi:hypothetical protein